MVNANSFVCICGFRGNAGHSGRCSEYQKEIDKLVNGLSEYIVDYYKESYSISECCEYVVKREKSMIRPTALRKPITKFLDQFGIREKIDGKKLNQHRQIKVKRTMIDRYGVSNAGQIEGGGWGNRNQLPITKLKISNDFFEYRKKVEYLTRKYLEKQKRLNIIPEKCYYTGIIFADNKLQEVNPNDPLKRSLDHKVSITDAFFLGLTPEQVCSEDNIVYCLRIVNTIKHNTNEDKFRETILPKLKERLKDENL